MSLPSSTPRQKIARDPSETGRGTGAAWAWDEEEAPPRRWSRAEAAALRGQRHEPSPWRVVATQAAVGVVASLLVGLVFGEVAMWSALFGAATAVGPGALMARGSTRMADVHSPLLTAMGLLGWESAKIICSMAMLVLAARLLHPVVWPALLAVLTACLAVYLLALRWRKH